LEEKVERGVASKLGGSFHLLSWVQDTAGEIQGSQKGQKSKPMLSHRKPKDGSAFSGIGKGRGTEMW